MTQEQLGNAIGKSKAYIADLESGKRNICGIAAETLLKIAEVLGTQAEDIIQTPEDLNEEEFEWEEIYENGECWLIVDKAIWSTKYNKYMVQIDETWYKLQVQALDKNKPINEQLIRVKDTNIEGREDRDNYYYLKCVPKKGIEVKLGREITKTELAELVKSYKLTEDDVSKEFVDKKGAIFGKYMKTYTSIQISVDPMEALGIEGELRKKGIEAANIASGRVNIRIK